MKIIESIQNPVIKKVNSLKKAKERKKYNLFCAEGLRTCSTLQDTSALEYLFVTPETLSNIKDIFPSEKCIQVPETVMKKISSTKTPSGILGVFHIPKPLAKEKITEGIILINVADPGNAGTLIRTCAAFSKKSVIFIDGVDPWNPKVIQATAGTIGYVNIFQLSWQEVLKHKKNLRIIGLVVSNGKPLHETNLKQSLLAIGNEAHGIPEEYLKYCDELITIEMPGTTESLNAAVAGSIAIYESSKI